MDNDGSRSHSKRRSTAKRSRSPRSPLLDEQSRSPGNPDPFSLLNSGGPSKRTPVDSSGANAKSPRAARLDLAIGKQATAQSKEHSGEKEHQRLMLHEQKYTARFRDTSGSLELPRTPGSAQNVDTSETLGEGQPPKSQRVAATFGDGSGSMEGKSLRLDTLGQPGMSASTLRARKRSTDPRPQKHGTSEDQESFSMIKIPDDSEEQQEIQFALSDSPSAKNYRTTLQDHPEKMSTQRFAATAGLLNECPVEVSSKRALTKQGHKSQHEGTPVSGSTCRSPPSPTQLLEHIERLPHALLRGPPGGEESRGGGSARAPDSTSQRAKLAGVASLPTGLLSPRSSEGLLHARVNSVDGAAPSKYARGAERRKLTVVREDDSLSR